MKRLTTRNEDGSASPQQGVRGSEILERLAEFEDIFDRHLLDKLLALWEECWDDE